jgi:hypothetical protein
MDLDRNQSGPAEEEWIAKYRAAVATIAMPQSRTARVRAVLKEVGKFFAAVLDRIAARSKPGISVKERLAAALTPPRPVEVPVRRNVSPTAVEQSQSEKAG